MKGLIGHTGFVGSNIAAQTEFDAFYNSANIGEIEGKNFDLLVCAGVRSVKWKANKNPSEDFEQIKRLICCLDTTQWKKLVLISTIAVYDNPADNAYGRHRLYLETHLQNNYENVVVVRLPALFGNGLKKNPIYDMLNKNYRYLPNVKSEFQYYCLDNIWKDIEIALRHDLSVLNICTEPTPFVEIVELFGAPMPSKDAPLVKENMVSRHAGHWVKEGDYLYTKHEVLLELKKFLLRRIDGPAAKS